jgi:hypothetical protein
MGKRRCHGLATAKPLSLNIYNDDDDKGNPIVTGPVISTPRRNFMPVPEIVSILKSDEQYLMNIAGVIRKPGLTWKPDWIKIMLDKFEAHLLSDDITHKSLSDFKKHFKEWIKFQPQPQRINNEIY